MTSLQVSAHRIAPIGGRLVTPVTVTLALLAAAAAAVALARLIFGIGATTNLNDGYPFGLWIVYDVVFGAALACGGYSMAILVYIFNRGEYHPLVRPAMLASLLGYTLAGVSIMLDMGRYWNAWHFFWPAYSQPQSVLFEVATCITLYIIVMWIEFSPVILERIGLGAIAHKLEKALPWLLGLALLLPTMHQSSLGTMVLIFGTQVNPLWQTGALLPLQYLMTAILLGFAAVVIEATLVAVGFKRPMETALLSRIARFVWGLLLAYLLVRWGDLLLRGVLGEAFQARAQSATFWVEMAAFVAPLVLLARRQDRRNPGKLFGAAVLLVLGSLFLRLNSYLIGYETGEGWHYFPSLPELTLSVGFVAFEILAYILAVRLLPVLPAVPKSTRPEA